MIPFNGSKRRMNYDFLTCLTYRFMPNYRQFLPTRFAIGEKNHRLQSGQHLKLIRRRIEHWIIPMRRPLAGQPPHRFY